MSVPPYQINLPISEAVLATPICTIKYNYTYQLLILEARLGVCVRKRNRTTLRQEVNQLNRCALAKLTYDSPSVYTLSKSEEHAII